jgi:hypothetical protein
MTRDVRGSVLGIAGNLCFHELSRLSKKRATYLQSMTIMIHGLMAVPYRALSELNALFQFIYTSYHQA